MGYHSRIYGEINITPPLTIPELEAVGNFQKFGHRPDLAMQITEEPTIFQLIDGSQITVNVPVKTEIVSNEVDECRADDVEDICLLVAATFPDRVFDGFISVYGEDNTDIWRMVGSGNKIFRETAQMLWPDGTDVESRY